jgi:hypothetical protein
MPSTHVGLRRHEAAAGKGPATVYGAGRAEKREAGRPARGGSAMEQGRREGRRWSRSAWRGRRSIIGEANEREGGRWVGEGGGVLNKMRG